MVASVQSDADDDVPPDIRAALKHNRRRKVVEYLHEQGEELSLLRLASRLATETNDMLPDVVREFHDLHLPKLTNCGLVEYDSDTGMVALEADLDVVEAALDDQ